MDTTIPTALPLVLTRVSHPAPHPHSGGGFGDLLSTFVHSIAASLGWQAGRSIASFLGPWLLVLAAVAIGWYLLSHRRTHHRTTRRHRSRRR